MPLICPLIVSQTGTNPVHLSNAGPRRYRKDAIRVGKFVARNPLDGSDLELDVTPERLDQWVGNFARMQANGVRVDLTVDHKRGADAKRGDIIALFRDGDVLRFDTDLADDDGVTLVQRCPEVSIEVEPNARDGLGNRYGEAITAITVCRQPVVPGQEPFQRIAASRGDTGGESGDQSRTADLPVLWFSAHGQSTGNPANHDPAGSDPMFSKDQLATLRKHHKLPDDAKDEAIVEKVMASLASGSDAQAALDKANEQVTALSRENDELKAKGKTITLSRDVAGVLEEAVDAKLGTLVEKGNITPACREKLAPLLKGGAVMLSREAAGEKAEKARSMAILEALGDNDPAAISKLMGERTGGQTLTLSRHGSEDDKDLDALEARVKAQHGGANK